VTGFVATIPSTAIIQNNYVMTPAGTLASGTLTMPAGAVAGQQVNISSSQKITAFSLQPNTGQTIVTTITQMPPPPAQGFQYILDSALAWHLIG
jgi:hypothetical protein